MKILSTIALGVVVAGASFIGYKLAASKIAVDIYRQRLITLAEDYESLRQTYNQAVQRTAVTELVVENDKLSVVIRRADGSMERIDTPFDPNREIYCDYVVLDGRLWIRRVYDDLTAPRNGLLLDPALKEIDWNSPEARQGNAVYRSLSEGRWVVTVTGDGSLGLRQATGNTPAAISPPPEVRDYEQLQKEIDEEIQRIDAGDVLGQLF